MVMQGTFARGVQIAWAGVGLAWDALRWGRRAPDRLQERVRVTLTRLGTTFIKLGQGLSLRWDLLSPANRDALWRLHSDTPLFPSSQAAVTRTLAPMPINGSMSYGVVFVLPGQRGASTCTRAWLYSEPAMHSRGRSSLPETAFAAAMSLRAECP
jgi:hypothetical protein